MEITSKISPSLHVLMVSFPAQGHINPLLRLAKVLVSKGLFVTFSTTQDIGLKIQEANKTDITSSSGVAENSDEDGNKLRFEFFSDGWDVDEPKRKDLDSLMHQLETQGKESFAQFTKHLNETGRPISLIINNPFVPWASEVAADLGIPSAVLWVQSCAVYSIYHHYHHQLVSFPTPQQKDLTLNLPGLPTLNFEDIPSFLTINPYDSLKQVILNQFKNLEKPFCVLADSFEELEHEIIDGIGNISSQRVIPIGSLFKLGKSDDNNNKVSSQVRGDMVKAEDVCFEWLDSQSPASVVYVSFGSVVTLRNDEIAEMCAGLLKSGLSFLWVLKPSKVFDNTYGSLPNGFVEEAKGKGLVVQWCKQEEVLAHPALSCFITHCGWNSSMESLSCGVPIIAFPEWGDQVTNAKFLVDVYGVGVRMRRSGGSYSTSSDDAQDEEESLTREEVERCILEVTKGEKAVEIKKNALKWKKAAEEAVAEGGSSYRNIQSFVDDLTKLGS